MVIQVGSSTREHLVLGLLCSLVLSGGCGDGVAEASRENVSPATGGSGGTAPVTTCNVPLADRVRVTTFDAGGTVLGNDEYYPVLLAPRPAGGALAAWREASDMTIRVSTLGGDDLPNGETFTLPGEEVHALLAHDDGGALVVLENDPDIYSDKYCRGATTPDESYCAKFDLVRFDNAGTTLWRTTLTEKNNVDSDGALFIWWYQHTARLVFGSQTYGVYFRSASSSPRPAEPAEVDIHAGDTLRFVDSSGTRLTAGWDWGCSHSWSVRLAYNGAWGAACHGDGFPNAHRLQVLEGPQTVGSALLHENMDPTRRALGGLVPTETGFWLGHIADGTAGLEVHVVHIDNNGTIGQEVTVSAATGLDETYPFRAYLAAYANDQMLLGWKAGDQLQLASLSRETGELIEGPVAAGASIDQFEEFVSLPNGDVGWAFSPGNSPEIRVIRVRGCE